MLDAMEDGDVEAEIFWSRTVAHFYDGGGCNGDAGCSKPVRLMVGRADLSLANVCAGEHSCAIRLSGKDLLGGKVLVCRHEAIRVAVDAQYTAVLDAKAAAFPIVLNRPALQVLESFSQPRCASDLPVVEGLSPADVEAAVARLYEVKLLSEVEAEHERR